MMCCPLRDSVTDMVDGEGSEEAKTSTKKLFLELGMALRKNRVHIHPMSVQLLCQSSFYIVSVVSESITIKTHDLLSRY
jgi:hypothetical protein